MLNSLLLEISKKEGVYALAAKNLLRDPSISEKEGLTFLIQILEQVRDAKKASYKMFGKDLIEKIDSFINPKKRVLKIKSSKTVDVIKTIYGEPSPGTLGDFWLLKEEYNRLDPSWINRKQEQWRRLVFNDQFMHYMHDHFKELHCEYCGKPNLKIFKWYERKEVEIICTVDHFLPKKDYVHLTEDPNNLFISCHKCNNDKKANIVSEDELKYRYDDSIRSKFVFDESKLNESKTFKR